MNRTNNKIFGLAAGVIMFAAVCILSLVSPALAQDKIQVMVNNQLVAFPDQQPFMNKDNRTLVPVRAPMEKAGAKVDWEGVSQTVVVSKDGIAAVFVIGTNQYKVNGEAKTMDTWAQVVNGRTCFPIRWVAEALGMQVTWDANSKTVKITSILDAAPGAKPMTEMTSEAKARLTGYAYPVDGNGKQYTIIRKMVEDKEYGQMIGKDILEIMKEPLSLNQVVKANQRFITDADLCYSSRNPSGGSRIRGVLQTTTQDGTITEQDTEFGFSYGTVFVKPGEPTVPSHWFSEYDTVQLSAPVRVK